MPPPDQDPERSQLIEQISECAKEYPTSRKVTFRTVRAVFGCLTSRCFTRWLNVKMNIPLMNRIKAMRGAAEPKDPFGSDSEDDSDSEG